MWSWISFLQPWDIQYQPIFKDVLQLVYLIPNPNMAVWSHEFLLFDTVPTLLLCALICWKPGYFFKYGMFHIMYLVDCFFLISSNLFYYTLYFLKAGSYSKDLIRLNFVCWRQELMNTLVYFLLHHVVCYSSFRESKIDQWVQVVWPWSLHHKDSKHFS